MKAISALLSAGALLLGFASACSSVQEDLECPGAACPESLQQVYDGATEVPGVESVERVWRFANLDKGEFGGIDVRASFPDEDRAGALAERLVRVYLDSDVEPTSRLTIGVVPLPESGEPASQTLLRAATDEGSTCAETECTEELRRLKAALAKRLDGTGVEIVHLAWSAESGTAAELAAGPTPLTQARVNEILGLVGSAAGDVDAASWGEFTADLSFQRRKEFEFVFDGLTGAPLE